MEAWMTFWTAVLYTGIGLFAVMSVYVIVWGFRDIRVMLRELRDRAGSGDDPDQAGTGGNAR